MVVVVVTTPLVFALDKYGVGCSGGFKAVGPFVGNNT